MQKCRKFGRRGSRGHTEPGGKASEPPEQWEPSRSSPEPPSPPEPSECSERSEHERLPLECSSENSTGLPSPLEGDATGTIPPAMRDVGRRRSLRGGEHENRDDGRGSEASERVKPLDTFRPGLYGQPTPPASRVERSRCGPLTPNSLTAGPTQPRDPQRRDRARARWG